MAANRILVLLVLLTMCCSVAIAQTGWQPLATVDPLPFRGVDFTDGSTGTVVGATGNILRTTNCGQTWTSHSLGVTASLWGVSFANPSVGVITGTDGAVLFTQNNGADWDTVHSSPMMDCRGAHMRTPLRGAVSGMNWGFTPTVKITTDGWVSVTERTFNLEPPGQPATTGPIVDIVMLSDSVLVGAGCSWQQEGAIVRSTNLGQTWSTVFWTTNPIYGVDFTTESFGVAVGAAGLRARTTDGGQTWEVLPNALRLTWWDVDFISTDIGWIVGENQNIYRTDDGGDTWRSQHLGTGDLIAIDMAGADTGYAVGQNGAVLRTFSGGEEANQMPTPFVRTLPADSALDPWEPIPYVHFMWSASSDPDGAGITYDLHVYSTDYVFDEHFITPDTSYTALIPIIVELDEVAAFHWTVQATDGIYLVGASNGEGVFFANIPDAAEESVVPLATEYSLTNYPNPFNASTVISFNLSRSTSVVLRAFDLTGREVFMRELGMVGAGTQRVRFDADGLASGIYVVRLETPQASLHHKMILLR